MVLQYDGSLIHPARSYVRGGHFRMTSYLDNLYVSVRNTEIKTTLKYFFFRFCVIIFWCYFKKIVPNPVKGAFSTTKIIGDFYVSMSQIQALQYQIYLPFQLWQSSNFDHSHCCPRILDQFYIAIRLLGHIIIQYL